MSEISAAAIFVDEARRLGFHRVGFTSVAPFARQRLYDDWIAAGRHGEMGYLAADAEARADPARLLDGARTIVSVALSYAHPDRPPVDDQPRGTIARYARGADYHMVFKPRLERLAGAVAERLGRPIASRACVDTAPLLEREAAARGGLGFLAKNTLIIAPGLGSHLLLGELLTDVAVDPAEPEEPRCGECRACLDACPTGAFDGAWSLDARRCISYLTIEARGPIPRELRRAVGDMVFGCDRCQDVCPWNSGSGRPADPQLAPLPGLDRPLLVELLGLGAAQFRKRVRRTALRRVHRAQLLRNVAVALGNVGGPSEISALERALDEPSPLVRAHVAWALGEIGRRHPGSGARAALESLRGREEEPSVREEIELALAT